MKRICAAIAVAILIASLGLSAQSPSSNKAFFARVAPETDLVLAPVNPDGSSLPVTLFEVPAALKTSTNGAVSATLSMEAALWTYNITTAIVNGGKASSSSRAAIKAWIEIDGQKMEPGMVVYADRLQATGLTLNLQCQTGTTCTVTGDATLELFQQTKNANAFTFFLGPLGATTHSVKVVAQAFIECHNGDGLVIACPTGTLAGYTNAQTQAAIGKATLLVEEQNNWGSNYTTR